MLLLITPSNLEVMPYVRSHLKIMDEMNIKYFLVTWDRLHLNENSDLVYHQEKKGHKRNFFDYMRYRSYVLKNVDFSDFSGVIFYGLQLAYFFKNDLKECSQYALDIRDYNKIIKFYNFESIVSNSLFVSISSEGFLEWLPFQDNKYVVHHNISDEKLAKKILINPDEKNKLPVKLGIIGSIRNPQENIPVIDMVGNDNRFELYFHGDGWAKDNLISYVKEKKYCNIYFTGRYNSCDEEKLYQDIDWSVVPLDSNRINSKTLLPNRLYNGAVNQKPILTNERTYTGSIVKEYKLGVVVDDFNEQTKSEIIQYRLNYNDVELFLKKVIDDNEKFKFKLKDLSGRD